MFDYLMCPKCGAAMVDAELHARWHRRLEVTTAELEIPE